MAKKRSGSLAWIESVVVPVISNRKENRTWVHCRLILFTAIILVIFIMALLCVTTYFLPKRQYPTIDMKFFIKPDSVKKYKHMYPKDTSSQWNSKRLPRQTEIDAPWEGRLPTSVIPLNYQLTITPYFYPEDVPTGRQISTFDGNVSITIQCKEATDRIILHTSTINILELSVINNQTNGVNLAAGYEEDPNFEFLSIDLTEELMLNSIYRINIVYVGIFQDEPIGFYVISRRDAYGRTRLGGVTHMQPTSARRVTPCFDEPEFKAEFDVSIRHRSDMTALSNGIELSITDIRVNRAFWKKTVFRTTPKMSTYLLALAVTHFISIRRHTESGILIRVWSPSQSITDMRHALNTAVKQTTFFESYFNYSYTLEKQDIVAVPYLLPLAMENWGLIFCQETAMMYIPDQHSLNQKEVVTMLMAHELGHQWVGNLVTPVWWDDLWLNEGFARYMEHLGADYCEPQWNTKSEMFLDYEMLTVMKLDSTSESHPLRQDVDTPQQIFSLFDVITYEKGGAIIRMLENMLSEEVFTTGLRDYIKMHAYGNTNTDDLWESLTKADIDHGGNDVQGIMDTWTLQPYYPLVTFNRTSNDTIYASQEVFLSDDDAKEKFDELTYGNITWEILLSYTVKSAANFTHPAKEWMHREEMVELTLATGVRRNDWYLANIGRYGYYRVNYDTINWDRLNKQLLRNHEVIPVQNRFQLLDDAFVLFESGELDIHILLNLTLYLHQELEYLPWRAATFVTEMINDLLKAQPSYDLFQKYWLQKLSPVFEHLGWEENENESPKTLTHRVQIVEAACSFGHENCLQTAKNLYATYMADPTNNPVSETSELRKFAYCFAIMEGGHQEWEFGLQRFFYLLNYQYYLSTDWIYALSCSTQPSLLNRLLEDAYYGRLGNIPFDTVVENVANHDIGLTVVWEFIQLRWIEMRNAYNNDAFFARLLEAITTHFWSEDHLRQLLEFGRRHSFESGSSVKREYQWAVNKVKTVIERRARYGDEVSQWMSSLGRLGRKNRKGRRKKGKRKNKNL